MPLEPPKIEDRTYKQLEAEMLSRIRVHNPEWTNFNESDPGVTLLQLFAFMGESILYRTNLIPDRNRRKFLSLLSIPMQPAASAQGMVTFSLPRGAPETVTLPRNVELRSGDVPFRTENGLDVLPVEAVIYYKSRIEDVDEELLAYWRVLNEDLPDQGEPVFYESRSLEEPLDSASLPLLDLGSDSVVDGSAWIALMARKSEEVEAVRAAMANKVLNLGIYPAVEGLPAVDMKPHAEEDGKRDMSLLFELSSDQYTDEGRPQYRRLNAVADDDVLRRPGVVALSLPGKEALANWSFDEPLQAGRGDLPPSLSDTRDEQRIVTWLRLRLSDRQRGSGLSVKLHWLGINCTRVRQRTHVANEVLGTSTGAPDFSVTLTHTPVIPSSLELTVDGEPWREVDDLSSAPPEIHGYDPRRPLGGDGGQQDSPKVFSVDRESGVVTFGNGIHGMRPPSGAILRASYDYGGGAQGNVNIAAINGGPNLPVGISVSNPLPTWGGAEGETVAEAERNIPLYLQHHDRLVTADDFASIVRRTPTVDVGRVEVLPLYDARLQQAVSPGVVTLMIIPREDRLHPEYPEPDQRMLELVCEHVSPRRLVTTEIHVRGPRYVPLMVSVGIEVVEGRDFPPIREAVNNTLKTFLSALAGGREGDGWPLQKSVVARELWAEATRVDGVSYVNNLILADISGNEVEEIALQGLQLPRLDQVETRLGDAEPIDTLLGRGEGRPGDGDGGEGGDGGVGGRIVPVPLVLEEC